MITAIVGANWGDEGKGKITDLLAGSSDIVVRFQGGSNAGHTIINDYGKFSLHQLPSGMFQEGTTNILANGVALNIAYLQKEIESVRAAGVDFKLLVSNRAGVLMPYHVLLDELEEERLADKKFGSTKSGIAPYYADKYGKWGLQVWELFDIDHVKGRVSTYLERLNVTLKHLYGRDPLQVSDVLDTLRSYADIIKPYVADTSDFLRSAIKDGKNILMEGQLGALRDIDHGIYPYVTSSSTLAGYSATGAGIPPYEITKIIAVTKAYSSAVGEGPFVTEFSGDDAEELRKRGGDAGEYGATTGRPRRVGAFDVVATRYGASIQGATDIALTCLDVLGYLDEIPVCTAYEIDGKTVDTFPVTSELARAKPVLTYLPGWKSDIRGITKWSDLPKEAVDYIRFLEKSIGVNITMVSSGPRRDEMIALQ
ncbi:adenylosuccinate synthase [Oscillospiraceae bacterium OttesenSCG-928-G22]|nr:adenylosuccinate synthase [Oscillospiraceae bacterium OttesenSCG-928-G22]